MPKKAQSGEHGTETFNSASVTPFPREQSGDDKKRRASGKEGLISQRNARIKANKCELQLTGGGQGDGMV